MEGKRVAVTGANTGMGLATAVELAKQGAEVVMICRNQSRGERALEEAVRKSGSSRLALMLCDLGSLRSIREFAESFKQKTDRLDVLINNAGVISFKRSVTEDGFESMMGINHLGHFLLANLLLEPLKRAEQGRIVVVSSGAHKSGRMHWDDPFLEKGFHMWKGYAQSKLANNLFTIALAERLKGTNATVNCLHPGAVATSIGVNRKSGFGKSIMGLAGLFLQSPQQGAQTALYLAASPEVRGISGEYYYRKMIARASAGSYDREAAEKLWAWSERMVGLEAIPR